MTELCDDVLGIIFQFLTPKELVSVGFVDKRFRRISSYDFVWISHFKTRIEQIDNKILKLGRGEDENGTNLTSVESKFRYHYLRNFLQPPKPKLPKLTETDDDKNGNTPFMEEFYQTGRNFMVLYLFPLFFHLSVCLFITIELLNEIIKSNEGTNYHLYILVLFVNIFQLFMFQVLNRVTLIVTMNFYREEQQMLGESTKYLKFRYLLYQGAYLFYPTLELSVISYFSLSKVDLTLSIVFTSSIICLHVLVFSSVGLTGLIIRFGRFIKTKVTPQDENEERTRERERERDEQTEERNDQKSETPFKNIIRSTNHIYSSLVIQKLLITLQFILCLFIITMDLSTQVPYLFFIPADILTLTLLFFMLVSLLGLISKKYETSASGTVFLFSPLTLGFFLMQFVIWVIRWIGISWISILLMTAPFFLFSLTKVFSILFLGCNYLVFTRYEKRKFFLKRNYYY